MSKDKDKDKIKVTDRRKFEADGTPREAAAQEPEPEEADAKTAARDAPEPEPEQIGDAEPKEDAEPLGEDDVGEVDFKTFLIGLGTQAMMFLGFVPDPVSKELEVNLPQAKQMIDIIALLQQKTEGNLDGDEAKLLETLLFDLRMQYIERGKKS